LLLSDVNRTGNWGQVEANAPVSKSVETILIPTFGRKDKGDGGTAETIKCVRTKSVTNLYGDFINNESILQKA
jgi:hypothetical protein